MYDRPANLFVAGFIGSPAMNLVEVPITDGGVKFGNRSSRSTARRSPPPPTRATRTVTVGVRPEHFDLVEHNGAGQGALQGREPRPVSPSP